LNKKINKFLDIISNIISRDDRADESEDLENPFKA
jgi:hypothetical protein